MSARILRELYDWFLGTRPGGFFDAGFFFPHPIAFATTDPAFGAGLTALPFLPFTGNYLVMVNLAILLSFPLTAYTT
ncbi:MAG: hypothetical protein WC889_18230, partial [Myxococcota bacterium]